MPLISVITITYNAAATLRPTLDSVAAQTFDDFEYLVIDGASADSTVAMAQTLPMARVISEPDRGLYDAMNKGLHRAAGEYVIFLNAGDAFPAPDILQRYAQAIADAPVRPGMVYGQTRIVDANRNYVGERHLRAPEQLTARSFLNGMEVCHQAMCVRRDLAPDFDLNYRFSADYDWAVKVLQRSTLNVYIPDYVADYLNEGVTTANHRASLWERFHAMRRHYGLFATMVSHLKKIFTICLLVVCISACSSKKKIVTTPPGRTITPEQVIYTSPQAVEKLMAEARQWIGTPYKYGGHSKDGTDCSGLVMELFLKVYNIRLPRSSAMQQEYARPLANGDLQQGDLVFFATGGDKNRVSHVGLYTGAGKMIHASSSRGVIESDLAQPYWVRTRHSNGRIVETDGRKIPDQSPAIPDTRIDPARLQQLYDALDQTIDSLYVADPAIFD